MVNDLAMLVVPDSCFASLIFKSLERRSGLLNRIGTTEDGLRRCGNIWLDVDIVEFSLLSTLVATIPEQETDGGRKKNECTNDATCDSTFADPTAATT